MPGALDGIRIVDMTAMITGPLATMILADQGAEVVKIEPPGFGDFFRYVGTHRGGIGAGFASVNRGKRSLVVNVQEEAGKELVRELAATADVFIQNFRHGVIDRLGLGESELRASHPELIYVSLNAFGERGSFSERPAFDHILQGMTGATYIQDPEAPTFMRQAWVDKCTAYTAAQAVTAALLARERGAGGQHVRLSMLEAGLAFLWPDGHANQMILDEDGQTRLPLIATSYNPAETKDGGAAVAAVTEEQWTNLILATERVELLADPRFSTTDARLANLDEFRAELAKVGSALTTEEFIERLTAADVPCGPLLRPEEVASFEQVVANECLVESEHPAMGRIREPRPPARFEATPSEIRRPAPTLGEHTDDVLRQMGRSAEAIEKLRAAGVVA
jgi:crotonobetainyl-CoA:carnitine CoA-transferase CaiB-like acyl-CoA transferase